MHAITAVATVTWLIILIAAIAVTALIVWNAAISYRKKVVESKLGAAEDKAREIIDDAEGCGDQQERGNDRA